MLASIWYSMARTKIVKRLNIEFTVICNFCWNFFHPAFSFSAIKILLWNFWIVIYLFNSGVAYQREVQQSQTLEYFNFHQSIFSLSEVFSINRSGDPRIEHFHEKHVLHQWIASFSSDKINKGIMLSVFLFFWTVF